MFTVCDDKGTRRIGKLGPQRATDPEHGLQVDWGVEYIAEREDKEAVGLHLLFASGKRPTRAALKDLVEGKHSIEISHDPFAEMPLQLVTADRDPAPQPETRDDDHPPQVWMELLREGLTFDIHGLAPGAPGTFSNLENRFDIEQSPASMRLEAITIVPGQHLAGAGNTIPVAKGLIALARDLVHHFDDLEAVGWEPSQSVIGKRYFESIATAWLEGGPFPALGLTAFRETFDGALQTVGLDYWIGQELRIEPPLSTDRVAATRLGVRLVNQLVLIGGLEKAEHVLSPDGSQLVMRPSRNGKFVRILLE